MTFRAVIFDVGGVLIRSETESGRRKWEERLGLAEGELARIVFDSPLSQMATRGEIADEAVWSDIAARFGLNADGLRGLQCDFWSGDRLDGELVDYLRSLRPRFKTALLSNAWPGARKALTEKWCLAEVVDEIVLSAEEGVAKPDAAIYRAALQRIGIQPRQAVFVDDMAANVEAARSLGVAGIQFGTREQVIADVRQILSDAT